MRCTETLAARLFHIYLYLHQASGFQQSSEGDCTHQHFMGEKRQAARACFIKATPTC